MQSTLGVINVCYWILIIIPYSLLICEALFTLTTMDGAATCRMNEKSAYHTVR